MSDTIDYSFVLFICVRRRTKDGELEQPSNMSTGNIYAISDIHVDQPENMAWIEQIPHGKYTNDTLILAGSFSSFSA